MAVLIFVAVFTLTFGATSSNQEFDLPPPPPSGYAGQTLTSVQDFFTLWNRGLSLARYFYPNSTTSPAGTVKTVVVPMDEALRALTPADAPNPLYSQEERYVRLRMAFITDYMLNASVTPFSPLLSRPEGYTVVNLNGRPLTFKKKEPGALTVNGVSIREHASINPCTHVYVISATLFDHAEIVDQAFSEMVYQGSRPASDSGLLRPSPLTPATGPTPPL